MSTWSISDVLEKTWASFKENAGVLIGATLVISMVQGVFQAMNTFAQAIADVAEGDLAQLLFAVFILGVAAAGVVVNSFLQAGLMRLYLQVAREGRGDFTSLFSGFRYIIPTFLVNFLMGIGVMFGTLLLIVPGIILWLGWSMALFFVVDDDLGSIEAMSKSWRLTKGEKWHLLGWYIVVGFLITLGLLLCCVGMLVTIPIAGLGTAFIYEHLRAEKRGLV